jgi:sugar phosphate isomerase/epimerase
MLVCPALAQGKTSFFAFDNGVGRGSWTPEQQAELLKELGYDGMGSTGFEEIGAQIEAFDERDLRVFSTYVPCYVGKDEGVPRSLKDGIKALKDTGVIIWLTVQGKTDDPDEAVAVVSEVADLAAASNLEVVLYPHHGFYVATIEDALLIAEAAKRDNLGVAFNLCHELRAGNRAKFDKLLDEATPHLRLVSINGADHEGDWDTLIQTLDKGEFDTLRLLKKLEDIGYHGPIGLQCYNIKGDTRDNLTRSMAAWQEMQKRLVEE